MGDLVVKEGLDNKIMIKMKKFCEARNQPNKFLKLKNELQNISRGTLHTDMSFLQKLKERRSTLNIVSRNTLKAQSSLRINPFESVQQLPESSYIGKQTDVDEPTGKVAGSTLTFLPKIEKASALLSPK